MENNSRLAKSTNNILFGILHKGIMLVLTFVSRTIFIQVLSAEYLGINGLFTDILTVLSMADLGLSTAMAYSFYEPLATKDMPRLAALTNFYKKIYSTIALVIAIVGISLLPFLKYLVNTDKEIPFLEVYYLIFLLNTVVSYLFVYKSTIIAADQKSYIISKYNLFVNLSKVIAQIIILYVTHNYMAYLGVTVATTLINNLLLSHKADCMYPCIKEKCVLDEKSRKDIFSNIKALFTYKLSSVLLNGTDNILISAMIGTLSVGIYSNYHMITYNLLTISNLVYNNITASIGNIIVKENTDRAHDTFKLLQMISFWISGVFTICLLLLSQDFICIWIGLDYLVTGGTLFAIALNFYFDLCTPPVLSFREATGLFQKTNYVMLISALLNLVLSILLGQYFGLTGIFMATFLAKVFTVFWYEPNLLYKLYFKTNPGKYYFSHGINLVIVIGSILLLNQLVPAIDCSSWSNLILKGILIFSIANIIYLFRYYKTPEFWQLRKKIGNLFGKHIHHH